MPAMTIDAHIARSAGFITTLGNGRHTWNADVGKALGSGDCAPDPHDLLDSALAACTALTLDLYLRPKGWPVTALHVSVEHVESRTADGGVAYEIKRRIRIDGELSPEQLAQVHHIAERCPIHRVLTGTVSIHTETA